MRGCLTGVATSAPRDEEACEQTQFAAEILGHASKFDVIRLQIFRCKHSKSGDLHFYIVRLGKLTVLTFC